MTTYIFEDYYETQTDLVDRIFSVTAETIAKDCRFFKASLFAPKDRTLPKVEEGRLPEEGKIAFVRQLVAWLKENSNDFQFLMDDCAVDYNGARPKFAHYESTFWNLHLEPHEFKELQKALKDNGLPIDAFYDESEAICEPAEPGVLRKFLLLLGLSFDARAYYSPKNWKVHQRKLNMRR